MRGMLTVVVAEIRQHRLVLWAGLAFGLLGIVFHSLARQPSEPTLAAWVLAWVLSIAVAFGLGMDGFAGDLRDGRLGFWLDRPLPLFHYWSGKMAAAYALALVAFLLARVPTFLFEAASGLLTARDLRQIDVIGRVVATVLGIALAAGVAVGGAVRVRSRLLVLDLVLLPLLWAAVLWALGGAWQAGTGRVVMEFAMPYLLVVAVAVVLAASALQVCVGRLELGRGRAWLSAVTWGGLLLFFVGGIVAFGRSVEASTPDVLRVPRGIWTLAPVAGSHFMIAGDSDRWRQAYAPGFLVDERGGFTRMGGLEGLSGVAWSSDGRHFAWTRQRFGPEESDRHWWDVFGWGPALSVHSVGGTAAPTRFDLDESQQAVALSPLGQRILTRVHGGYRVIDAGTARSVANSDDPLRWKHAAFLSETTVRALRIGRRPRPPQPAHTASPTGSELEQATVVDWDLPSGRLTERGTLTLEGARVFFSGLTASQDWQRVLRVDATGVFLHDLDGRVSAALTSGWSAGNRVAGPLSGDRYGCLEEEAAGLRLRVFAADGSLLVEARLPGRFPIRIGGEPRAGLLALEVSPRTEDGERATLLVDLASGTVVRRVPRFSPALRRWQPNNALESPHLEPGSLATRLLVGEDGLVALDPATGATTVVLAARARGEE